MRWGRIMKIKVEQKERKRVGGKKQAWREGNNGQKVNSMFSANPALGNPIRQQK